MKPREFWIGWPDAETPEIVEPGDQGQVCFIEKQVADKLAEVVKVLRNEVRGTLSAHELAIRYDSGNSNWECLEIALAQAEEALKEYKGES